MSALRSSCLAITAAFATCISGALVLWNWLFTTLILLSPHHVRRVVAGFVLWGYAETRAASSTRLANVLPAAHASQALSR